MLVRALAILVLVLTASLLLTWHFGADILLALGLILAQLKLLGSKVASIQPPAALAWLKTQAALFFRVELLKKYFYSTLVPVLLGAGFRRRMSALITAFTSAAKARFEAMMAWYRGLDWHVRLVATLIVLVATLGLSVASLGLWLILFSVQLPFWLLAFLGTTLRSTLQSLGKYAFKTVMFLQLGWLWRLIRRRLPPEYLERKRRFDFRLVRRVVRHRRMTLGQLEAGHNSIALRLALLRAYLSAEKPQAPTRDERARMRSGQSSGGAPGENAASDPGRSAVQPGPSCSSGSDTTAQPPGISR